MSTASARRAVTSVRIRALDSATVVDRPDVLVTEEPMEIRVHGPGQEPRPLAVTMRTPGHDFELAAGFCLTEGIVSSAADVESVAYCLAGAGDQEYNVVTVKLRRPAELPAAPRQFVASASCGLCGKTSLDEIAQRCAPVTARASVARSVLTDLPGRLRAEQSVFDATGGLHAAALFGLDGELLLLREDVGRHNALDKLIGYSLLRGEVPLSEHLVMVSGRVSFEIVQKAAIAGVPVLCAVSAPSSLAVSAAARLGQTLVGFLRGDRANVYAHPERIDLDR